jgi:glutamine synthetase
MLEMVKKDFTEGLLKYQTEVTATALSKKQLLSDAACALETGILSKLDAEAAEISKCIEKLEKDLHDTEGLSDSLSQARAYHDKVLRDMEELRFHVDHAESMIPESCLPYPTYSKLLFSLR